MLTRLYVDNYKRLVNFDYRPGQIQLLMGGNGSGKSSVFEVLAGLRELLIEGESPGRVFPATTRTRWLDSTIQTFAIEALIANENYTYELRFNQVPTGPALVSESLSVPSGPVFLYVKGQATRFDDQHTKVVSYSHGNVKPLFPDIPVAPNAKRIGVFRRWLKSLVCVNVAAPLIRGVSDAASDHPDLMLTRFVGWYHHLALEYPEAVPEVRAILADVMPGLQSLALRDLGQNRRILRAKFNPPADTTATASMEDSVEIDFDELSFGQRTLIVLHTLLLCAMRKGTTLCIDEPDNYVSLREIQPWLMALQDRATDLDAQVLLISHHPELLNQLAANHGHVFAIRGSGGVTVEPYKGLGTGLPPSEEVARGWENA